MSLSCNEITLTLCIVNIITCKKSEMVESCSFSPQWFIQTINYSCLNLLPAPSADSRAGCQGSRGRGWEGAGERTGAGETEASCLYQGQRQGQRWWEKEQEPIAKEGQEEGHPATGNTSPSWVSQSLLFHDPYAQCFYDDSAWSSVLWMYSSPSIEKKELYICLQPRKKSMKKNLRKRGKGNVAVKNAWLLLNWKVSTPGKSPGIPSHPLIDHTLQCQSLVSVLPQQVQPEWGWT